MASAVVAGLPTSKGELVSRLHAIAQASKRQKLDGDAIKPGEAGDIDGPDKDVRTLRYSMGGDDTLYLQLGMGILHGSGPEQPLAPAALYSAETVEAIQTGTMNALIADAQVRTQKADEQRKKFIKTLNDVFYNEYQFMDAALDIDASNEQIIEQLEILQIALSGPGPFNPSATRVKLNAALKDLEKEKADLNNVRNELTVKERERDAAEKTAATRKKALQQAIAFAQAETARANEADELVKTLSAREQTLEEERRRDEASLKALKEELQVTEQDYESVKSDLKTKNAEAETARETARQLSDQKRQLETDLAAAAVVDAALKGAQLEDVNRRLKVTEEDLARKDSEVSALEIREDASFRQIKRLNKRIKTNNTEIAKLKSDLEAAKEATETAQAEVKDREIQITQLNAKIADLEFASEEAVLLLSEEEREVEDLKALLEKEASDVEEMQRNVDKILEEIESESDDEDYEELFFDAKEDPSVSEAERRAVGGTLATPVRYALARGLCGHRGPHEGSTDAPTDALLEYNTPRNIAHTLARVQHLRAPASFVARAKAPRTRDPYVVAEVRSAIGGDYAIDAVAPTQSGVRDARAVRWEPRGPHANSMATAATLEHAAARCRQLASSTGRSPEAKKRLVEMEAAFKLQQLDSLYEISCAIDDGADMCTRPEAPMVTRPVARLRGALLIAHDAGHHPTPATVSVSPIERWTAADQKAHVAFRSTTNAKRYMAPPVSRLGYVPSPTGAQLEAPPIEPAATLEQSITKTMQHVLNYGFYTFDIPSTKEIERSFKFAGTRHSDPAEAQRSGVWNDFLRDAAINTDRVWAFVRNLSGLMGEDATTLVLAADETATAAAREQQKLQQEASERATALQSKLVEALVASLIKDNKLQLDLQKTADATQLVVLNADRAKELNDLASGTSGRPFFEANVALRDLTARSEGVEKPLGELVENIKKITATLKSALVVEAGGSPQTSIAELERPRNSHVVRLRDDAVAAIRAGYDKFLVESALRGIRPLRLFELVEGCDPVLSMRFAEFCGFILVQNRSSTGVSALYASRTQLATNSQQAFVALHRALNVAGNYATSVRPPVFGAAADTQTNFRQYFAQYRPATEAWVESNSAYSAVAARLESQKFVYGPDLVSGSGPLLAGLMY